MRALACSLAAVLCAASLAGAATSTDLDVVGADGVKLRATYTSPGKKGPAMLLIHQCNSNRGSWTDLTDQLVEAGVHVLTMDLRGFGDSPGEPISGREAFQQLMQKSPGDVDAALALLLSQKGVDGKRIGVGGASCGAMLTADLAARNPKIHTLMLLSGPPSESAVAHIADDADLSVFVAAATEDSIVPGIADRLRSAAEGSPNEASKAMIIDGTEHGVPMFSADPDLEPALVEWLITQLKR